MVNPQNPSQFIPLSESDIKEYKSPFARPVDQAIVDSRHWPRFSEGEVITIKGIAFRVHEIGETRLVLKFAKS